MITCQGKSVYSGVAIGKIFVYKKADNTVEKYQIEDCLLYTSPSPRDQA